MTVLKTITQRAFKHDTPACHDYVQYMIQDVDFKSEMIHRKEMLKTQKTFDPDGRHSTLSGEVNTPPRGNIQYRTHILDGIQTLAADGDKNTRYVRDYKIQYESRTPASWLWVPLVRTSKFLKGTTEHIWLLKDANGRHEPQSRKPINTTSTWGDISRAIAPRTKVEKHKNFGKDSSKLFIAEILRKF